MPVGELSNAEDAFRAAGQLVAAIAEGMPIESISSKGIVLKVLRARSEASPRCRALAEIAVGLVGIAAVDRYGFGTAPPGEPGRYSACAHWTFNAQQLEDFAVVRELIAAIDPDDEQDILSQAWDQALAFIHDKSTWKAIEFFVALVDACELDGADIDHLCPDAS